VADALIRGHRCRASEIHFHRQGDELIVGLPSGGDLLLEERAIDTKGDLFRDIYGVKIRLEEG
jgi:exopolyphosphatase/guanosine-5'-triphosphate,3'-diphosphate pyrophosphatase